MHEVLPDRPAPRRVTLDNEEQSRFDAALGPPLTLPRSGVIRHQGAAPDFVYLLIDGWACSSVTLSSGERQLVKVHLPGDLLGTPSVCLPEATDTLYALSPATVRRMPVARFGELFAQSPGFAAKMFLAAQRERVELMDRVTVLGAKRAVGRLAAMLIDFHDRLGQAGKLRDDEFVLRMTQDEIGDYLGLTAVHVNRTFRQLEVQGAITRRLQRIRLLDLPALVEEAGFVRRALSPNCIRLFQLPAD